MNKDLQELNDNELMLKVGADDKSAFELLFKRYYSRLCEFSYSITTDTQNAKDVVHDVFLSLWQNRKSIQVNNIKPYLFQAVKNNSVKQFNRQLRFDNDSELATNSENVSFQDDFELREKIDQSLQELPDRCREIFIMSRFNKMSHNEIAEKLGISSKTVEVQIRKANLVLREKLKDFAPLIIFLILNKGF